MQRAPHFSLLATPDNEDWKHVRKTTNVAFNPNTIREASYLLADQVSSHDLCPCVEPEQHSSLQGFPIVHQRVLKAAEVLDELCKQGLVDVNDLASRFTAGKSC